MRMPGRAALLAACVACGVASASSQPVVGPEFQVNGYTTGQSGSPSVAVSGSGGFVIAWMGQAPPGTPRPIFARRYDSAGTPLDAADIRVNTFSNAFQGPPSVAVAPGGEFVVAWPIVGADGSGSGVFARRFDGAGAALDPSEFQVNTYTSLSQTSPSVGIAVNGDFVVAWAGPEPGAPRSAVFARRFDGSGSALDVGDIQVNEYPAAPFTVPSLGVAPSGDFVVVWDDWGSVGRYSTVFGRRFDSSGNPMEASEFQVNSYTTGGHYYPSIGVSGDGSFIVAWEWEPVSMFGLGIHARRFASSGAALDAGEFQVSTYTWSDQAFPSVGVADSGDFVVAWQSDGQDGSGLGVFARRFESTGQPIDAGDVRVDARTASSQLIPSASFGPAGRFVIAWQAADPDVQHFGVFAGQGSFDTDGDGIPDIEDIVLTMPVDGDSVDCRTPRLRSSRPLITWTGGAYDRFRVQISWDPSFPRDERITSGRHLLGRSRWKPDAKAWRRVCRRAGSEVYIRVFGIDGNVGKSDPFRKTFSNETVASVIP